ncbi:hypothetical protein NUSPORA_02446 [Nucleospora cyclopteri]
MVELEGKSSKKSVYLKKHNFNSYNDSFETNNTFNYNSVGNTNYSTSESQVVDIKTNNSNYQNSLSSTTNFENRQSNFLPISSDFTYNFKNQSCKFDDIYSRYYITKKRRLE